MWIEEDRIGVVIPPKFQKGWEKVGRLPKTVALEWLHAAMPNAKISKDLSHTALQIKEGKSQLPDRFAFVVQIDREEEIVLSAIRREDDKYFLLHKKISQA